MGSMLPIIARPDIPMLPGWWPIPPGWWLLGLAVFLCFLWSGYLFFRRFIRATKARQRRELPVRTRALAALDELEHRRPLSARQAAYRLNEILRAALFDDGVVRDGVVEDDAAWEIFWQELEVRYHAVITVGEEDVGHWLMLAHGWVEHLPVSDAEHDDTQRWFQR